MELLDGKLSTYVSTLVLMWSQVPENYELLEPIVGEEEEELEEAVDEDNAHSTHDSQYTDSTLLSSHRSSPTKIYDSLQMMPKAKMTRGSTIQIHGKN